MTEPTNLIPKLVLSHLRETNTTYPQVKSFFGGRGKSDRITPGEAAERGGMDVALWAMRTLPEATHPAARQLAAAFAFGPDGELAEAYRTADKGSDLFGRGIDLLMAWTNGDAPDEAAARMRWDISVHAQRLPVAPRRVLETLGCAFAPKAWGGCGLAHEYALDAHAAIFGRTAEGREAAVRRATEYHIFLLRDIIG